MKRCLILFLLVLLIHGISGTATAVEGKFETVNSDIIERGKDLQKYQDKLKEDEKELSSKMCEVSERVNELIHIRQKELQNALESVDFSDLENRINNLYAEAPSMPIFHFESSPDHVLSYYPDKRNAVKSRLMVMYRLVDQLGLDEDTATKFFPAYLTYINSRDKLMKEHREIIRKISEDADDESVSIKDLKEEVVKFRNVVKKINEERDTFLKKSETILDERQYIKLIVFEDKLKEDLIMRFRSERLQRSYRRRAEELQEEELKKVRDLIDKDK